MWGLGFGVSGLGLVILILAFRRIIANLMTIGNQIINHNRNRSHHSSIHDNNKSSRSENNIIASAPKNKIICDCLLYTGHFTVRSDEVIIPPYNPV